MTSGISRLTRPDEPTAHPAPHRMGDGFAPFSKQLRHVVCVRGVYNAALATQKVDWTRKHEHYLGPLTREALLAALDDKQRDLLTVLKTTDIEAPIDWDGQGHRISELDLEKQVYRVSDSKR